MEHLKPADLIGERGIRQRVLTDVELKAIWSATDQVGYPVGQIVKLLILTGQRLNDIAMLSRAELDLDAKLIAIPATRMKSDRAHEVPLAQMALAILQATPRLKGPFIFSANGGRKFYTGWARAKERLDKLSGVQGWVLHDLRRTFRTRIAAFQVSETVKELCIAHAIGGLHAVYDQHSYRDEKLAVFKSWEALLASIIGPAPVGNVVSLPRRKISLPRKPIPKQPAPQRPKTA
jgi:integrase